MRVLNKFRNSFVFICPRARRFYKPWIVYWGKSPIFQLFFQVRSISWEKVELHLKMNIWHPPCHGHQKISLQSFSKINRRRIYGGNRDHLREWLRNIWQYSHDCNAPNQSQIEELHQIWITSGVVNKPIRVINPTITSTIDTDAFRHLLPENLLRKFAPSDLVRKIFASHMSVDSTSPNPGHRPLQILD